MEEQITLEGWKGKGDIELYERVDSYRICEKRKKKETGEVYEDETVIPKKNVDVLFEIILKNCQPNEKYGYKYLVRKVLEHYKFHEDEKAPLEFFMEAFNGGRNRAAYYFPYFYYPLKVLEGQGKIQYWGRRGITLL